MSSEQRRRWMIPWIHPRTMPRAKRMHRILSALARGLVLVICSETDACVPVLLWLRETTHDRANHGAARRRSHVSALRLRRQMRICQLLHAQWRCLASRAGAAWTMMRRKKGRGAPSQVDQTQAQWPMHSIARLTRVAVAVAVVESVRVALGSWRAPPPMGLPLAQTPWPAIQR